MAIVEHRDATAPTGIREIGTSAYCFTHGVSGPRSRVTPRNQQGEYYLTDVALLAQEGCMVEAVTVDDPREGMASTTAGNSQSWPR